MDSIDAPLGCEEPLSEVALRLAGAKIQTTTKSSSMTVYSRNFQQHLVDNHLYPPAHKNPDGRRHAKPDNWDAINARLAQRRPSFSPSDLSEEAFEILRKRMRMHIKSSKS